MHTQILMMLGIGMLTLCGMVLGRQLGLQGGQQVFLAGFGLAIVIIAHASMSQLQRRVAALEARLAARSVRSSVGSH